MTLAAVWVEHRDGGSEQLCFARDSRTTPGPIEGVTKVFLFAREDLAGVWAGDYRYASLVLAHLDAFFTTSEAMRRRDIDVWHALEKAAYATHEHLRISNKPSLPAFDVNYEAQRPETTTIIVGGYSILRSEFVILRVEFVSPKNCWSVGTRALDPHSTIYIGDHRKSARARAKKARLHVIPQRNDYWHMEPLAAIHRAIEDDHKPTIGGIPQLAKVFKHGSSAAYGLRDPFTGDVWSRAARVPARGQAELLTSRRLIDLSLWLLDKGQYANRHQADSE